jgi:hypothetical protein
MWLRWTSINCAHAKYILKVDDDIFVNIFNMIAHVRAMYKRQVNDDNTALCLQWDGMPVQRDVRNKWFVLLIVIFYNILNQLQVCKYIRMAI